MQNLIRTKFFYLGFLFFLFVGCNSHRSDYYVENISNSKEGLFIQTNQNEIYIHLLSDDAFEVKYKVDEKEFPSYALDDNLSYASATLQENRDSAIYHVLNLKVSIHKDPFQLSFYKGDSLLFKEEQGLLYSDTLKGFRMSISNDEKLMGGGERVLGMDRRGHRLRLYNRASYGYETHADLMYYSMPVVVSSRKYMLLFDNVADGWLDLGKSEKDILQLETKGGRMSYVVVGGSGFRDLTQNYTQITGRQPMPPRWALGNISSRMGYRTQEEVENVVSLYQKDNIPLDAMVLDLFWFGPEVKGYMGNLEWDKNTFPEPQKMIKELKDDGVKTVLITEPFILKDTEKYNECIEKNLVGTDSVGQPYVYDFYFGTTTLLDIFKPATKDWFWDIYKKHTLSGVDGWWGDLGEPELHPDDLVHVNGAADMVHNAYGHEWAKLVYEGFKNDFPDKRPVILMRSGFAGSQRYGMIPWSGDVNRTWGGLQSQVEISLQMGIQGLAYMHSDLGGFAGNYKDAELYTRWLQYGVFQPVFRTHAQSDVPPEPVFWDVKTKDIARKFIQLRYMLTPYLYTMVYENSTKGTPLMRPLFYQNDDTAFINNTNTYMWGDNFLVSPVTEKGVKKWSVDFPDGANWFNYFTDQKYKGGQRDSVNVTINEIPVFVKGGSFIPTVKVFNNMEEYNTNELVIHYYKDMDVDESHGYMYNDDGKTNKSWLNNQYEKLNFKSKLDNDGLKISISRESFEYEGNPEERKISFVIHNVLNKPDNVFVNGDKVDCKFQVDKKTLFIDTMMQGENQLNVFIN